MLPVLRIPVNLTSDLASTQHRRLAVILYVFQKSYAIPLTNVGSCIPSFDNKPTQEG